MQKLEIDIFTKYLKESIYNLEITNNHTINNMLRYIHINLENHFSLNNMAKELGNSPSYLSNLFSKEMSISVIDYVHNCKINRAKMLLKTTSKSILEIALLLGYCNSSHFSKTFKSIEGISPLKYLSKI